MGSVRPWRRASSRIAISAPELTRAREHFAARRWPSRRARWTVDLQSLAQSHRQARLGGHPKSRPIRAVAIRSARGLRRGDRAGRTETRRSTASRLQYLLSVSPRWHVHGERIGRLLARPCRRAPGRSAGRDEGGRFEVDFAEWDRSASSVAGEVLREPLRAPRSGSSAIVLFLAGAPAASARSSRTQGEGGAMSLRAGARAADSSRADFESTSLGRALVPHSEGDASARGARNRRRLPASMPEIVRGPGARTRAPGAPGKPCPTP